MSAIYIAHARKKKGKKKLAKELKTCELAFHKKVNQGGFGITH